MQKIISITFPFSESNDPCLKLTFHSWQAAESALARVTPPKLGYYKTDFKITWEDGDTYEGRYDIGCDAPSLEKHIRYFCNRRIEEGDAKEYQEFLENYQIGD